MALTNVFPPSAKVPAVPADTREEVDAEYRASRENNNMVALEPVSNETNGKKEGRRGEGVEKVEKEDAGDGCTGTRTRNCDL